MTDQELNQWLHENVMGKEWKPFTVQGGGYMDARSMHSVYPDYCQSLDAVRAVEEKVIETVGFDEYLEALIPTGYFAESYEDVTVMAPARQRAEACKNAWENNNG